MTIIIILSWFAFDVAFAPFAVLLARRLAREFHHVGPELNLDEN